MEEQKKVKCAIYTRKSTDEGLDKEFNTLEAQREAGENYVRSQKHQGWIVLPERYDDGGFSGGNINRPALKKLMNDVENGKIDMIVVYKIDRLTRSLADFSKLIEVLDKHKCSFVSVTQNFNTYDSMGRLTLNVLLSFAQFEREVGAERIRDKVAASRKKGMWMGGSVPLGYDIVNKRLIVNPQEAEVVRLIYNKYCGCRSEREVCAYINELGYKTKVRKQRNKEEVIATPFTLSKISYLLRNPIYIGKVVHKGTIYEGQQEAIITEEQWNRVQKIKNNNRDGKFLPSKVVHNSLLKGFLECGCGCDSSIIPTRTTKKNKTYEYYVSLKAVKHGYHLCELGSIPAGELDKFVISKIQGIMKHPKIIEEIAKHITKENSTIGITEIFNKIKEPEHFFDYLSSETIRQIIERIISRIVVYKDRMIIRLLPFGAMLLELSKQHELQPSADQPDLMELTYKVDFAKKRGHIKILPPKEETPSVDDTLLNAIVKAYTWKDKLDNTDLSIRELAKKEKIDRGYLMRIMKLTYLAPDIIESIMIGTQPNQLKISDFMNSPIPISWIEQRKKYGFII